MTRTNKAKTEAKKQTAARKETALRGKALASEATGTGSELTSRQQVLAAKKSKVAEKRAGKNVAVSDNEESDAESADEPAPLKKARMSKGKEAVVERDRDKTPSIPQLYDHLKNGVAWTPTRFADTKLLSELGLDTDIEAMLKHLKMPKLGTMAYPFYKEVSCQFLSSLVVTYHDTQHAREGWGKITFKINGKAYNMSFKEIGRVMGFQDLENYLPPKVDELPAKLWNLISGNKRSAGTDKNSHIRHPSVRYLHRMLVHAFYPRKQAGTVTEEDLTLLFPAIQPYATHAQLPFSTELYAEFGLVSFFVGRLEHYRDWAWYTTVTTPKIGIGGLITPLLEAMGISLGTDGKGPYFMDAPYLRIATYFSGLYKGNYVYYYKLKGKPVEILLPNKSLTSLDKPDNISFKCPPEAFLGEHGSLTPIGISTEEKRSALNEPDAEEFNEPIYGQPRYTFKPYDGTLPPGALRDAHDHISRLQRWNKAQDRTIEKLKDKCKTLSKTVKQQARASAKILRKMADVLTRGGIAGCSRADFEFPDDPVPQPPPNPSALGFPLTARQLQRRNRNPPIQPSTSGNKSPSLASSDEEIGIEEVESQPQYADYYSAPGGYYTSFPPHDDEGGPSAFPRSP